MLALDLLHKRAATRLVYPLGMADWIAKVQLETMIPHPGGRGFAA